MNYLKKCNVNLIIVEKIMNRGFRNKTTLIEYGINELSN